MYNHPEIVFLLATETQQRLRAEADHERLLAIAGRARRPRRWRGKHASGGSPAGNLAECAPAGA